MYILFFQEGIFNFEVWSPKFEQSVLESGIQNAVAPMPGIVSKVLVDVGSRVTAGDPVLVLIAMKMEVSYENLR